MKLKLPLLIFVILALSNSVFAGTPGGGGDGNGGPHNGKNEYSVLGGDGTGPKGM